MSSGEIFLDLIEKIVKKNSNTQSLIIAKVVSPPPNLKIEFGGVQIPSEQIYCSNYLLPNYKRNYKLSGIIDEMTQNISDYSFNNSTLTELEGPGPHKHLIKSLKGSGNIESTGDYKHHGEIWFTDTLEVGVEVLVAVVGVFYVVMDRIVKMPSEAIEGGG